MRKPPPGADLRTDADRYVTPDRRYLELLHGNVLRMPDAQRAGFGRALAADARQITDGELTYLLGSGWRAQLTAAWLAGLTRRDRHRDHIGELLQASRVTFAGQGFCFALARFGTDRDAELLAGYLDRYLPRLDLSYDQHWAMGALLFLDARLGTRHAHRFLADGAWQRWADAAMPHQSDPGSRRAVLEELCSFADDCLQAAEPPVNPS